MVEKLNCVLAVEYKPLSWDKEQIHRNKGVVSFKRGKRTLKLKKLVRL